MANFYQKRLEKIQSFLQAGEAFFVGLFVEVFYLTGFTGGDSYLLLTKDNLFFLTDSRYTEQARQEKQVELEIMEISPEIRHPALLASLIKRNNIIKLYLCKKDINLEYSENLINNLNGNPLEISNSLFIKEMRMCKDEMELEIMRQNLMITELGYHYIIRRIKEGLSESEVAGELEYFLRKKGAMKTSFDTIVSSGNRTTLPHGTASDKIVKKDEIIMLDFGILKNGYTSDFTRCYYFGKIIGAEILKIHSVVLNALKKAESIVKPGIKASDVHRMAYETIKEAGYEKNFWHSTGHGVGLEVHEAPSISFADNTELKEGMVFTVEPGIYVPGLGGIRLEDMVVVRKGGFEVLTSASYEL